MTEQPRDSADGTMERTIAAAFLLANAILLGLLDLTVALSAFAGGAGGLAVMRSSGLQDASLVFGFALAAGLIAAMLLAWMGIEVLFAVRALRGDPRSLLMVSLGGLGLSLGMMALMLMTIPCGLPGLALALPMVLTASIATASAAIPAPVPRRSRE